MALNSQICRYRVTHETLYKYSTTVTQSQHFAHLTPRNTAAQSVLEHELLCNPPPAEFTELQDYFGNLSSSFLINEPHDCLSVTSSSTIEVQVNDPSMLPAGQPWEAALHLDHYQLEPPEIAEMRLPSPFVECLPQTLEYALGFFRPGRPWLDAMLDLTRHIYRDFTYDPQATTVSTPVLEVFENRRGVCQDFAHLMLSCLRSLKLPARYVSGYILNEPPPGVEKLAGSDASHAWIESWSPDLGWTGFDPTNGKMANHEFMTLAWGRDYMDVTPLRGVVLGGGTHKPEVKVSVVRIP
jgi:transglutaminase-like putative cysteine protease